MGAHRNFSRSRKGQGLGDVASAEREPITGSRGRALDRVSGAKTPPEAESFEAFYTHKRRPKTLLSILVLQISLTDFFT